MSINYGSLEVLDTPQPLSPKSLKRIRRNKTKKVRSRPDHEIKDLQAKTESLAPKMRANLWKPGQSGNPSGKPKSDLAAMIARAVFAQDPDKLQAAFFRTLSKGNPKAFTALADRGFGKLTEHLTIDGQVSLSVADRLQQARKRISASNIVTVEPIKQENE